MGYHVRQIGSNFRIEQENLPKVFAAIQALAEAAPSRYHFDGVDVDVLKAARSVTEQLREWGWRASFDLDGNLNDLQCLNEKLLDDEQLFAAIAPFVVPHSYLAMYGDEDDRKWQWLFDGAKCHNLTIR